MPGAGSDHPNGAMGADEGDREAITIPQQEQRRQVAETRREPSTYVLEEDENGGQPPAEVRRSEKKEAPAKAVDWTAEATRIRNELQGQVAAFQNMAAVPLLQQLQQLPHPSQFSSDQLASMTPEETARYNQGIAQRASLENIGGGVMPLIGGMQNQLANMTAMQISQLQRGVHERHPPDIAEAVMELAKNMNNNQLAMPETYDYLADMAYGKKERSKRENQQINAAGARVGAAGRGGYSDPVKGRVAGGDMKRLATLMHGDKRAMEATIRRLEAEGYTSQD